MKEFSLREMWKLIKGEDGIVPSGTAHAGVFVEGEGVTDLYVGAGPDAAVSATMAGQLQVESRVLHEENVRVRTYEATDEFPNNNIADDTRYYY